MMAQTISVMDDIKKQKVVPLAVASRRRLAEIPEVPTFTELNLDDVNHTSIYSLVAPRGVPTAIGKKLHDAVNNILKSPATQEFFTKNSIQIPNDNYDLPSYIKNEYAFYRKIVEDNGLKLED